MNRSVVAVLAVASVAGFALPAGAEIVFFSTGRTMSVKSHRIEGTSLVLSLRGGGEVVCDASAIARIEPDEVPYPEDTPVAAAPETSAGEPSALDPPPSTLLTSLRYDPIIADAAARHGVDPLLVRAVIQVESSYQYRARSARGAKGLMQLMPATARRYGVANPYDPVANIDAGTRHLRTLLDRFPLRLALAAYNAGEAAVDRFGGVPPYAETRTYVDRILRLVGRRDREDFS